MQTQKMAFKFTPNNNIQNRWKTHCSIQELNEMRARTEHMKQEALQKMILLFFFLPYKNVDIQYYNVSDEVILDTDKMCAYASKC